MASKKPARTVQAARLQMAGGLGERVTERLRRFDEQRFGARLWARDAQLWKDEPEHQQVIAGALGWLDIVGALGDQTAGIKGLVEEVRADGLRDVVLLGMGGSSLAPEVLRHVLGVAPGYLDLRVLDSTDPAAVLATERSLDLSRTLFIVSSKSGGTTETASFHAYFFDRLVAAGHGDHAGQHFIAITDEGTSLAAAAQEQQFRAVFLNPADIGGRFSALSFFGLVPAAFAEADLDMLLERAAAMVAACGAEVPAGENPGLHLGAALGELGLAGRDKVTLVASPAFASFGSWVEQLLAESTGKEGKGLLPVDLEPLGGPEVYDDDRVFVYVRHEAAPDAAQDEALATLAAGGQPVITIQVVDAMDVGQEFFRWEIATAAAGASLGIDPFDQPNVQESKDNTKRLLEEYGARGGLPRASQSLSLSGKSAAGSDRAAELIHQFLAGAQRHDYVAFQAYVPPSAEVWRRLTALRVAVRDRLHLATTAGYGPRFLHSTGQYHKGGPDTGLFVQFTCADPLDAPVPGEPFTFGLLKQAQALGDREALQARGRRVLSVDLGDDVIGSLERFSAASNAALGGLARRTGV